MKKQPACKSKTPKRKPRHKHEWRTIQSMGAWGHIAECTICKERAEFVARD